ncbi:MAG: hypothetical protein OXG19_02800 [Chloroflexi bacterium]|nr:hypothetical protein [Chloroflexota bacterium]
MRPLLATLARLALFALIVIVVALLIFLPLAATGGFVLFPAAAAQDGAGEAPIFVVATPGDGGDGVCDVSCTLRDALLAANAAGGARVHFAIGAGPVRLFPVRPLPTISGPGTVIDGTTQPGWRGDPIVMIDGAAAGATSGLVSIAPRVEFRGLVVGNFAHYGLAARGTAAVANRFLGNWVGTDPSGRVAAPNRRGGIGVVDGAAQALVGDSCEGCGNRLAGNSAPGRSGYGVVVGGAGRTGFGLVVGGAGSSAAQVVNNTIGLGSDGAALPNDAGVLIVDGGWAEIGGAGPNERNLISGNRLAGIELRDAGSKTMQIQGNWIGLAPGGAATVGNDVGIFIHGAREGTAQVIVGGLQAASRNVISGNRVGLALERGARAIAVIGNWIGLSADGASPLPNEEDGVSVLRDTRHITIGGSTVAQGNYIMSAGNGVTVEGAAGVSIQNNGIGVMPDGSLVGSLAGIMLRNGARETIVRSNRIGGSAAGVLLLHESTVRNRVSRNLFLGNAGIAIDLGGDGPTANDPGDADAGPNGRLNTPVILGASPERVHGSASPGAVVELYAVAAPGFPQLDRSGFGPGGRYLGETVADAAGEWSLEAEVEPGAAVSAIAIDAAGNTSEFAANFVGEQIALSLEAGFTPVGWFGEEIEPALAFETIAHRLEAVFRYDAGAQRWETFRPILPRHSSLGQLRRGDALWLLLSPGPPVAWAPPAALPVSRALALQRGFNFVTWAGPPRAAAEALAPLAGRISSAYHWNPERGAFEIVFHSAPLPIREVILQPGDVLWLSMTEVAAWQQR